MNRLTIMTAALALATAAPAAAEYRAVRGGSGYAERVIGPDQLEVSYRGDKENQRTVTQYAMRRAAEVTLANGFEWFMLTRIDARQVDRNADTLNRADAPPNDRSSGAYGGGNGQADPVRAATNGASVDSQGGAPIDPGLLARRSRRPAYETVLTIQMGRGRQVAVEDPLQPMEIFDAASVAKQYAGKR